MNTILHLDMDAFFAAVELLDNPDLAGKPVIVGAPPDKRGVVSTASYEARRFGVHSAMPSRRAGQLCPQGIFLPVRMDRYLEMSGRVMGILESFTPFVEPVSIDEAFLDVRGVMRRWGDAVRAAQALKQAIRDQLGLTASVGVARNKFLAKLASDLDKPDGLTVVPDDDEAVARWLAPLPIGRLWGVGHKTEEVLWKRGLRTIGDAQKLPPGELAQLVGEGLAEHLAPLAWGRDSRPVETAAEAKSISSETTFAEDMADEDFLRQTLVGLVEHVGHRLRAERKRARTAHVKIRFADFRTLTRQLALVEPSDTDQELVAAVLKLFAAVKRPQAVRLLGAGVSGLSDPNTGELLLSLADPAVEEKQARRRRLDRAVDAVRERFGDDKIGRGGRRPGL